MQRFIVEHKRKMFTEIMGDFKKTSDISFLFAVLNGGGNEVRMRTILRSIMGYVLHNIANVYNIKHNP